MYLLFFQKHPLLHRVRSLSTLPFKIPESPNPKSNLSARLSFVFDQIDAIDNQTSEKFDALQRIRQWRESRAKNHENCKISSDPDENKVKLEDPDEKILILKRKEVEVVHPWKEWIELMERLGQQNYFDCGRSASEERVAESVGIDLSEVTDEVGFDFSRDWTTVRNACINFGKDRFDILRRWRFLFVLGVKVFVEKGYSDTSWSLVPQHGSKGCLFSQAAAKVQSS